MIREVLGALPALSRVEIGEHQFCRLERAVSIAQGDPDAVVPKSDKVCFAVTGHIRDKARVLVDAPSLVVAQVC